MPLVIAFAALAASTAYAASQRPGTPKARNLAQEAQDSLETQIKLAPQVYESEKKYAPLYDELERERMEKSLPGFLSLMEKYGPRADAISQQQTSRQRSSDIGDIRTLGPEALAALRAADPARAALLDELTNLSQRELQMGSKLDPSLQRLVQQSVRSGQAARGMGLGPSDLYEEALATGEFGQQLRNERIRRATGMVGLRSAVYGDPFMQILGRPSTNQGQSNFLAQSANQLNQQSGPGMFDPFNAYTADLNNTNYNGAAAAGIARGNQAAGLASGMMGAAGGIYGGYLAGGGGGGGRGGGGGYTSQGAYGGGSSWG